LPGRPKLAAIRMVYNEIQAVSFTGP
jgi:hypothetical protein